MSDQSSSAQDSNVALSERMHTNFVRSSPSSGATDKGSRSSSNHDVNGILSRPSSSTDRCKVIGAAIGEPSSVPSINPGRSIAESTHFSSAPTKSEGRANAFAQLVRGWESYMSGDDVDPFQPLQQPLQILQQGLSICGHSAHGLARLSQGSEPAYDIGVTHPLAPPALRHTHSSPNQFIPPMMHYGDSKNQTGAEGDLPPPPVPLDPFQRSSSTPSAFRQHSAYSGSFGTANNSAFTLPSSRVSYTGSNYIYPGTRYSAFDPVKYYATALEDMERTSIEVTDITPFVTTKDSENTTSEDKTGEEEKPEKSTALPKRGAAFRAARFLSDVRVLRRKRKMRNGRENPAQPSLNSSAESKTIEEKTQQKNDPPRRIETAVTIVTETSFENPNDSSMMSRSSEVSAIVGNGNKNESIRGSSNPNFTSAADCHMSDNEDCKEDEQQAVTQYQQLDDSDLDEEDNLYRRIDSQLQIDSPGTVPSPSYQNFVDERPTSSPLRVLPNVITKGSTQSTEIARSKPRLHVTLAASVPESPSPSRMEGLEVNNLTPGSTESLTYSPGTTRSFGTGSSSGHTTNATSISSTTNPQSGLSTISETDREVMETNKEARRRRVLDRIPSARKNENDASINSSSTGSTNPHGYFALAGSPTMLRDGANVPVERFFTNSPSSAGSQLSQPGACVRTQTRSTTSSRRSGTTTSPSAGSASATNTSSSSSSQEEPPKFVSYMDREFQSDLTTFREALETSSQRGDDGDEREPSPAPSEVFGYSEFSTDDPKVSRELRMGRLDRLRSRPPRSPSKGMRPVKTPPPRGSLSPLHQLSPPRNIVDHPSSNISRPYVRRSAPVPLNSFALNSLPESEAQIFSWTEPKTIFMSSHIPLKGRTYEEQSVEITNTESMEGTNINTVTPEKDTGSP